MAQVLIFHFQLDWQDRHGCAEAESEGGSEGSAWVWFLILMPPMYMLRFHVPPFLISVSFYVHFVMFVQCGSSNQTGGLVLPVPNRNRASGALAQGLWDLRSNW